MVTTPRNVVTSSTKLKNLSAGTCGDMPANNPLSRMVDPPETCLPDRRARSKNRSTLSLAIQHQATIASRHEKHTHDPRPERGRYIMKTSMSHSGRKTRSTHLTMTR
ncbi:hypothetical protein B296_00019445 [Ensete ventricosum]|uniref:Uncharacterized protein n=1 Tax=Ensete ventricosum TaxID=4639 RepID=A0A427AHC2_ENSVE|nr:hypothetical protein B296_00019445 [Ensete ventricosum]